MNEKSLGRELLEGLLDIANSGDEEIGLYVDDETLEELDDLFGEDNTTVQQEE